MDLLIKLLLSPATQWALLTLLAGLAWLCRWRCAGALVLANCLLALLLTCRPLADALAAPLENRYPAFAQQQVRHIAVLGCLHAEAAFLPLSSQMENCSVNRLVEAAQLWHQQPQALIHLSGSLKTGQQAHTEVARRFLLALGIAPQQIRLHPNATNTQTEIAVLVAAIAPDEPLALVTSAMHMPRAMNWFARYQRTPVPAPTDYQRRHDEKSAESWLRWLPSLRALNTYHYAFYEYSGLLEQSFSTLEEPLPQAGL